MQINPTPLAIALAIILSAPFLGTHAAPHGQYQRFATIEPRQGAAERNANLPHMPMEGLWPTSATTAVSAASAASAAGFTATVTSFETVTVVPTQTMAPIRRPKVLGGTMKPVSVAASSKPLIPTPASLLTPTPSTALDVNTIIALPSLGITITVPSWSTIVVPTPSISIVKTQKSSTSTPSSSPKSTPTPTPSQSQDEQDTPSSTPDTCPATAVTKCCTSLDKVSNSLLSIVDNILPLLNLEGLLSDSISSSPIGLSCTDLTDDGVCENVTSCCTEETILGFDSVYMSCIPLL